MRCGTVAIVGRTNVGKSTFLNACLGERIAIVSPVPQTTRDELLGVVHRPESQIAFTDTPGFHRPKTELGRRMNHAALDSVRRHDVVLFMTDVGRVLRKRRTALDPSRSELEDALDADDRRLLQLLPPDVPCVLVLNKIDLLGDKSRMLPMMAAFNEAHPFTATIPISVLSEDGVERVLDELERLLPEGAPRFAPDDLTDRPMTFFVREYVREQIMLHTRSEVPHAVAVTVERFEESPKLLSVQATIHVEKAGQRAILIGQRGQAIKTIGTAARERLEELAGKQVYLELFVRVTERWKDTPRMLRDLGYEAGGSRDLSSLLPADAERTRRASKKKVSKKKAAARRPNAAPKKGPAGDRKPSGPKDRKPSGPKDRKPNTGKAGKSSARRGDASARTQSRRSSS